MICFISGGITNVPDYENNFLEAVYQLKTLGFNAFDPSAMFKTAQKHGACFKTDQWMEICCAVIKQCDAVYFLNNWESSNGAGKEHAFAERLKIPMLYQKNFSAYRAMELKPEELINFAKANAL